MLNDNVSPDDLKVLEKIKSIIEKRGEFYGNVLVKTFVGDTGQGWGNASTTFTILPKASPYQPGKPLNYSNVIYKEVVVSIDSFINILEKLVKEGKLAIPESIEISVEGQFNSNQYHPHVQSKDKVFNLEWSADFFQFESRINKGNFPFGPYVSPSAPLYPSYMWLLEGELGISRSYFHQFWQSVLIFLPNYKAKIIGVRLGSKQLTISTEKITKEKLIAKIFLEDSENISKPEIEIKNPDSTIPIEFVPDHLEIHLLSADTGESIDYRTIYLSWPSLSEDIEFDFGTEDIEQMIGRGEGDQIEFKQEINTNNKERFVETLVSFSNTFGGTILVGVDDHGNIVDLYAKKLEETIQNLIRSHCEPPIDVKVENKIINEKNIFVVSVMEGQNKPYTYRGKGVYIRSGSTNRIATRDELDEFYKSKEDRSPGRERLYQGRQLYKQRKRKLSQDSL